MGFGADRTVGHGTRGEAADDRTDRLHLRDRHRFPHALPELEKATQGGKPPGLVVDQARVLLEDVVAPLPGGVLELENRLRVEEVVLAIAPPPVLPSFLEGAMCPLLRVLRERHGMVGGHLGGQDVQPHSAQSADGPGEAVLDHLVPDADRLEYLGTGVGGHCRDAHFGHDLQEALVECLHHVPTCLRRRHRRGQSVVSGRHHGVHRGEGEVRADGRGPVPEQEGHVMDLACISALDDQADPGPGLLPDEVVVDRTGRQE